MEIPKNQMKFEKMFTTEKPCFTYLKEQKVSHEPIEYK